MSFPKTIFKHVSLKTFRIKEKRGFAVFLKQRREHVYLCSGLVLRGNLFLHCCTNVSETRTRSLALEEKLFPKKETRLSKRSWFCDVASRFLKLYVAKCFFKVKENLVLQCCLDVFEILCKNVSLALK